MSTASRASTVVAVDARSRDVAAAEHVVRLLDDVLPSSGAQYLASTHVVGRATGPHLAVVASWPAADGEPDPAGWRSLVADLPGLADAAVVVGRGDRHEATGPEDLLDGAREAADAHVTRGSGRLARYPGQALVERRVRAGDVVALSAVDAVEGLAGTLVEPASEVDLTGWARPTWQAGRTVLLVQQGLHGLVPFELREQIPCCSDH